MYLDFLYSASVSSFQTVVMLLSNCIAQTWDQLTKQSSPRAEKLFFVNWELYSAADKSLIWGIE